MQKNDVIIEFGASVRAWRKRLGLSQEVLAERAELHRTYISDVERGARNLSLESISRLAKALNIPVAELFRQKLPNDQPPEKSSSDCVNILLVEDNADDVALTLRAFKQARFTNQVAVAKDGEEALEYIFCQGQYAGRQPAERPHMILLDLNLPKISGLEVLRRLKGEKTTRTIPVVILSVSQMFADMEECQRLGAETYLVKPVNFQRLSLVTPQLNLDWVLFKPEKPQLVEVRAVITGGA